MQKSLPHHILNHIKTYHKKHLSQGLVKLLSFFVISVAILFGTFQITKGQFAITNIQISDTQFNITNSGDYKISGSNGTITLGRNEILSIFDRSRNGLTTPFYGPNLIAFKNFDTADALNENLAPLADSIRDFTGVQGVNGREYLYFYTYEEYPEIYQGETGLTFSGNIRGINFPISNYGYKNIGKNIAHPGKTSGDIIGSVVWKRTSSITGNIKIVNKLDDDDNNCGNGIKYNIEKYDKGDKIYYILTGNTYPNNFSGVIIERTGSINQGESIYFELNNNGDSTCDGTYNHIQIFDIKNGSGGEESPTWAENGRYSGALAFNGNQTFGLGTGINQTTSGITISARLYTNDNTQKQSIVKKDNSYGMRLNTGKVWVITNAYYMRHDTGIPIENSTRTHITWTYDGHTMKAYKDGLESRSKNIEEGDIVGNDQLTYIGYDIVNSEGRNGMIDELRIYNTALTSGQIKELYDSNLKVVSSGDNSYRSFITNKTGLIDYKYYYTGNYSAGILISTGTNIRNDDPMFGVIPTCSSCIGSGCIIGSITNKFYFYYENYICKAPDPYGPVACGDGGSCFGYHTYNLTENKYITGSVHVDTKGPTRTGMVGYTGSEGSGLTITGYWSDGTTGVGMSQSTGFNWTIIISGQTTTILNTGKVIKISKQDEPITGDIILTGRDYLGNESVWTGTIEWYNKGPSLINHKSIYTGMAERDIMFTLSGFDTGSTLTYQRYFGSNCTNEIIGATGTSWTTGSNKIYTGYFSYKIFDQQGSGTCGNLTGIRTTPKNVVEWTGNYNMGLDLKGGSAGNILISGSIIEQATKGLCKNIAPGLPSGIIESTGEVVNNGDGFSSTQICTDCDTTSGCEIGARSITGYLSGEDYICRAGNPFYEEDVLQYYNTYNINTDGKIYYSAYSTGIGNDYCIINTEDNSNVVLGRYNINTYTSTFDTTGTNTSSGRLLSNPFNPFQFSLQNVNLNNLYWTLSGTNNNTNTSGFLYNTGLLGLYNFDKILITDSSGDFSKILQKEKGWGYYIRPLGSTDYQQLRYNTYDKQWIIGNPAEDFDGVFIDKNRLNPGGNYGDVVVGRESQINTKIEIDFSLTDEISTCGDGIGYTLFNNNKLLVSGFVNNGLTVSNTVETMITKGSNIYLLVDSLLDNNCDTTEYNIKIYQSPTTDLGLNNNYLINSGAEFTTTGKIGGAYNFNTIGQQLISSGSWTNSDNMSISTWLYREGTNKNQTIIQKRGSYGIVLFNDTIRVTKQTNLPRYNTNIGIQTGVWTHLGRSYDGNIMTLYINGEAKRTNSIGGNIPTNNNTTEIGYSPEYGQWFGMIDELYIYNYAISPDMFQTLYQFNLNKINIDTWGFSSNQTGQIDGLYKYRAIVNEMDDEQTGNLIIDLQGPVWSGRTYTTGSTIIGTTGAIIEIYSTDGITVTGIRNDLGSNIISTEYSRDIDGVISTGSNSINIPFNTGDMWHNISLQAKDSHGNITTKTGEIKRLNIGGPVFSGFIGYTGLESKPLTITRTGLASGNTVINTNTGFDWYIDGILIYNKTGNKITISGENEAITKDLMVIARDYAGFITTSIGNITRVNTGPIITGQKTEYTGLVEKNITFIASGIDINGEPLTYQRYNAGNCTQDSEIIGATDISWATNYIVAHTGHYSYQIFDQQGSGSCRNFTGIRTQPNITESSGTYNTGYYLLGGYSRISRLTGDIIYSGSIGSCKSDNLYTYYTGVGIGNDYCIIRTANSGDIVLGWYGVNRYNSLFTLTGMKINPYIISSHKEPFVMSFQNNNLTGFDWNTIGTGAASGTNITGSIYNNSLIGLYNFDEILLTDSQDDFYPIQGGKNRTYLRRQLGQTGYTGLQYYSPSQQWIIDTPIQNFDGLFIDKYKINPGYTYGDAVIGRTSPISANIKIELSLSDDNSNCGDGINYTILKGEEELLSGSYGDYEISTNIKNGSGIYLRVNSSGDNDCDTSNYRIKIYQLPETNIANNIISTPNYGINNGAIYQQTGRYGGAFEFNDSNQYINIGTDIYAPQMSVSLRVYKTSNDPEQTILIKTGSYGLAIFSGTLQVTNKTTQQRFDTKIEIPENTRTHIGRSYDGSIINVYINGKLEKQQSLPGTIVQNTNNTYIGYSPSNGQRQGMIDELFIYSGAITSGQFATLYEHNLNKIDLDRWTWTSNQSGAINEGRFTITETAINGSGIGTGEIRRDFTGPVFSGWYWTITGTETTGRSITGITLLKTQNIILSGLRLTGVGTDINTGSFQRNINGVISTGINVYIPFIDNNYLTDIEFSIQDKAGNITITTGQIEWTNVSSIIPFDVKTEFTGLVEMPIIFTASGIDSGNPLTYQRYSGWNCLSNNTITGEVNNTYTTTRNTINKYLFSYKVSDNIASISGCVNITGDWQDRNTNSINNIYNTGLDLQGGNTGFIAITGSIILDGKIGTCGLGIDGINYTGNNTSIGDDYCIINNTTSGDIVLRRRNINTNKTLFSNTGSLRNNEWIISPYHNPLKTRLQDTNLTGLNRILSGINTNKYISGSIYNTGLISMYNFDKILLTDSLNDFGAIQGYKGWSYYRRPRGIWDTYTDLQYDPISRQRLIDSQLEDYDGVFIKNNQLNPGYIYGDTILGRKSSVNANIEVVFSLSDANSNCGDGITYEILQQNKSSLSGGNLLNKGSINSTLQTTILSGSSIYLKINSSGNNLCDTTNYRIQIYQLPETNISQNQSFTTITGVQYVSDGKQGGAFKFTNNNEYLNLGTGIVNTGAMSISLRINPENIINDQTIIYKYGSYGIAIFNGTIHVTNITTQQRQDTTITLDANKRTHIGRSYDKKNMLLYKNGENVWSGQIIGTIGQSTSPTLVGYSLENGSFKGKIDELYIYNYAISKELFATLYQFNLNRIGINTWLRNTNLSSFEDGKYDGRYSYNILTSSQTGGNLVIDFAKPGFSQWSWIATGSQNTIFSGESTGQFIKVNENLNITLSGLRSIGNGTDINTGSYERYIDGIKNNSTGYSVIVPYIGNDPKRVEVKVRDLAGNETINTGFVSRNAVGYPVFSGILGITGTEGNTLNITGIWKSSTGIDIVLYERDFDNDSIFDTGTTSSGIMISFPAGAIPNASGIVSQSINIKAINSVGNSTITGITLQRYNVKGPTFSGFNTIGNNTATGYESNNITITWTGYDQNNISTTGFDWTIKIPGTGDLLYTGQSETVNIPAQNEPITGEIQVVVSDIYGYSSTSTGIIQWLNTGPIIAINAQTLYTGIVENPITFYTTGTNNSTGTDTGNNFSDFTYKRYNTGNCNDSGVTNVVNNNYTTVKIFSGEYLLSYQIFDKQGSGSCHNFTGLRVIPANIPDRTGNYNTGIDLEGGLTGEIPISGTVFTQATKGLCSGYNNTIYYTGYSTGIGNDFCIIKSGNIQIVLGWYNVNTKNTIFTTTGSTSGTTRLINEFTNPFKIYFQNKYINELAWNLSGTSDSTNIIGSIYNSGLLGLYNFDKIFITDANDDFSEMQNGKGWSYYRRPLGTGVLTGLYYDTTSKQRIMGKPVQSYDGAFIDKDQLNPGKYYGDIVLGWQSSINANIEVQVNLTDENTSCGDGVKYYLLNNTDILASGFVNALSSINNITNTTVTSGSNIYLMINSLENNNCDTTKYDIKIYQLPTTDIGSKHNHLTNSSANFISGKFGGAYNFDTIGQYLDAGTGLQSSHMSISTWLYRVGTQTGQTIIQKRGSYGIVLFNDTIRVTNETNYKRYNTSGTIPTGVWTHLGRSYDGEDMILYINGKQVRKDSIEGNIPSNNNITAIGYSHENKQWFGTIDELYIYNYAISPDMFQTLYQFNLNKINIDTWGFSNNQILLTDGQYNYKTTVNNNNTSGNIIIDLKGPILTNITNLTGYEGSGLIITGYLYDSGMNKFITTGLDWLININGQNPISYTNTGSTIKLAAQDEPITGNIQITAHDLLGHITTWTNNIERYNLGPIVQESEDIFYGKVNGNIIFTASGYDTNGGPLSYKRYNGTNCSGDNIINEATGSSLNVGSNIEDEKYFSYKIFDRQGASSNCVNVTGIREDGDFTDYTIILTGDNNGGIITGNWSTIPSISSYNGETITINSQKGSCELTGSNKNEIIYTPYTGSKGNDSCVILLDDQDETQIVIGFININTNFINTWTGTFANTGNITKNYISNIGTIQTAEINSFTGEFAGYTTQSVEIKNITNIPYNDDNLLALYNFDKILITDSTRDFSKFQGEYNWKYYQNTNSNPINGNELHYNPEKNNRIINQPLQDYEYVFVNSTTVYPGGEKYGKIIYERTSTISGSITINTIRSDADLQTCTAGDGVTYTITKSGNIIGTDIDNIETTISSGEKLYFTIDPKTNNLCDKTNLNIKIYQNPNNDFSKYYKQGIISGPSINIGNISGKQDLTFVIRLQGNIGVDQPLINKLGSYGLAIKNSTIQATVDGSERYDTNINQSKLNGGAHLVRTYNGTWMRIYINGKEARSSKIIGYYPLNTNSTIIGDNTKGGELSDFIDELRVYNKTLNAAEIEQLYLSSLRKTDGETREFIMNQTGLLDGKYMFTGYINGTDIITGKTTIDVNGPIGSITNLTGFEGTGIIITTSGYDNGTAISGYQYRWKIGNGSRTSYTSRTGNSGIIIPAQNEPITGIIEIIVRDESFNNTTRSGIIQRLNVAINTSEIYMTGFEGTGITFTASGYDPNGTINTGYQRYSGYNCTDIITGATGMSWTTGFNEPTTGIFSYTMRDAQKLTGNCSIVTGIRENLAPIASNLLVHNNGEVNITFTASGFDIGSGLLNYQWYNGSNCNSSNIISDATGISFTTGSYIQITGTFSYRIRDAQGMTGYNSINTGIYCNIATGIRGPINPIASSFVISSETYNKSVTGNWKALSSGRDSEYLGTITGSIYSGDKGTCNISGDIISFTPRTTGTGQIGTGSCTIKIVDNNTGITYIKAYALNIETTKPTTTITNTTGYYRSADLTGISFGFAYNDISNITGTIGNIYYLIITGDKTCSTYNTGAFTGYTIGDIINIYSTSGTSNIQTVCYYSTDERGNQQTYQKQLYNLDNTAFSPSVYIKSFMKDSFEVTINVNKICTGIINLMTNDGSITQTINLNLTTGSNTKTAVFANTISTKADITINSFDPIDNPFHGTYQYQIDQTAPSIPVITENSENQTSFVLKRANSIDRGAGIQGYNYQVTNENNITLKNGFTETTGINISKQEMISAKNIFVTVQAKDNVGNISNWSAATLFVITGTTTPTTNTTIDTQVDQFSFSKKTNIKRSTAYKSNEVVIMGLSENTLVPINISKGNLYINSNKVSSTGNLVKNGDVIQVELTSSDYYKDTAESTVSIGSVSSTFTIVTESKTSSSSSSTSTFIEQLRKLLEGTNTTTTTNTTNTTNTTTDSSIDTKRVSAPYTAPNGKVYKLYKTKDGKYGSYNFTYQKKLFNTLTELKTYISKNNPK